MIPYSLDDVLENSKQKKFSVVTTFAGGGGSSTGYRLAGGHVLLANEFIDEAAKTYSENYPDTPVEVVDIRHITRRKYVTEWFSKFGIKKGNYDLLDGSPPCASFSVAGSMFDKRSDSENVVYSDTKQSRIGFLIHDFVYVANVTQPKVVVLENVTQIHKSDIFQIAVERLRRWGYLCCYKVLEATDYGVAQTRRRLFLIGIRPDIAEKVGIRDERQLMDEIYPEPIGTRLTLRDVLRGVEINPEEREMLLTSTVRSTQYEFIKRIPKNPDRVLRIKDVEPDWKTDFSIERFSWDRPARTITQMGVQLSRPNYYHPDEDRPFGVQELKRIMGLPDDFVLTGTFDQKCERLGRMVPSLMTKAVAERINERVFSKL